MEGLVRFCKPIESYAAALALEVPVGEVALALEVPAGDGVWRVWTVLEEGVWRVWKVLEVWGVWRVLEGVWRVWIFFGAFGEFWSVCGLANGSFESQ